MKRNRIPVSKETLERLSVNTSQAVGEMYPVLCESIAIMQACDADTPIMLRLAAELRLDVLFIIIDLSSSYHALVTAEKPVEKRFHLKNLMAEMLEGYKMLWGYGKAQKKTIWSRLGVELSNLDGWQDDEIKASVEDLYNAITERLELLAATDEEKGGRDLTYHYDDDFGHVYRYTLGINDEEPVSQRCIAFLDTLQLLLWYVNILMSLEIAQGHALPEHGSDRFSFVSMQKLFAEKLNEHGQLKKALSLAIDRTPKIDEAAGLKSGLERGQAYVVEKFPIANVSEFGKMRDLSNMNLLLQVVLSDLAIATLSYLNAGSAPEFPLVMRRLTITRVSALSHLYGYDEREQAKSIWARVRAVVPEEKTEIKNEADEIETLLRNLIDEADKADRQIYVHMSDRKSGLSSIPAMIERLECMNPVLELSRTEALIRTITKIQHFLADVMRSFSEALHERSVANLAEMKTKIMSIREMARKLNFPKEEQKRFDKQFENLETLFTSMLS